MKLLKSFILGLVFLAYEVSYCQENYYSYNLDNFRKAPVFNELINTQSPDVKILDAIIFYITNEVRNKHHLTFLEYHHLLEESALLHSGNMVEQKFFDHINPKSRKYKTPEDRARYVGIQNPFLAENIIESFVLDYKSGKPVFTDGKGKFWYKIEDQPLAAHTYLSLAERMVSDWMDSPGHKANILAKKAIQLGCGTSFFGNKNGMPSVMGTQNFQLYEPVKNSNKR
jgi:uncharacterized protein YkwD